MAKLTLTEQNIMNQPRHEILHVADTVAREKGIDREEVIVAMEHAIQKTAKIKYGSEHDIRAVIDRDTGSVHIYRCFTLVAEVTDNLKEISLNDAKISHPHLKIGEILQEELPNIEFGRVAAQSARQVIFQKVREAERARQYEEFKSRVGDIINGSIKRIEFGHAIIDLDKAEAILPKDQMIPREVFKVGDRVRCLIHELRPEAKGPMVILSRSHPKFMAKLFEQEVPEIYDGIIEVKSVARDPGSRAKMAVYTSDSNLDPVGSCVGMRGSRVQVVVNELQGEKVDIIPWSDNIATYVVNALAPAEVAKVLIDEESHRVDVVVAEDQLSLAIGRRGQNVKLASQLTGWRIDILTEEQDTKRRFDENKSHTDLFMEALDVDEMISHLLVSEGFSTIEEIAYLDLGEFTNIEGFDEDIAQELQTRAKFYLENLDKNLEEKCRKANVQEEMFVLDGMNNKILSKLCDNGIQTLDALADLAGDELQDLVGSQLLTIEAANSIIMAARARWFIER